MSVVHIDRVHDCSHALDQLLQERDDLIAVLDRVVALQATAQLIRVTVGVDSGFVADLERPGRAVVRCMAGTRTDQMQNLVVPVGQGIGGRAMALGRAVRVNDYLTSSMITHQFDAQVRCEGIKSMIAVPVISRGQTVAIAYAAMRNVTQFGDCAVNRMREIADHAAAAIRVAAAAEDAKTDAVCAERNRMQNALHDTVGALLFSIGAQVRSLSDVVTDNPELDLRISQLRSDISAASSALRESLLALNNTDPDRALAVELAEHTRSFEARTGVPARFVQLDRVPPMDSERTGLLVAVAREGLLNIEKHARPLSVVVSLGMCDGGVQLVVADDGSGQVVAGPGTCVGVRSLVDRAARLGGRVSLVRDDDGGHTLRAWLP
ncbi:GAF domain-containing protein [Kutzneria sp. NPDC052558]|uniref:GAF domain-containing sensor histidine kinase n=1 Tax=Kutzneria sp. NPDC052558 TaxID=3364121 RepID=UPI0037C699A8